MILRQFAFPTLPADAHSYRNRKAGFLAWTEALPTRKSGPPPRGGGRKGGRRGAGGCWGRKDALKQKKPPTRGVGGGPERAGSGCQGFFSCFQALGSGLVFV